MAAIAPSTLDLRPAVDDMRNLGLCCSLIALGCALAGCVPLPVPADTSGDFDRLDERAAAALRPGVDHRDQVLALMGEPTHRAPDDRWWAYAERHIHGHWAFATGGPYVAGVLLETNDRVDYRFLFVYFGRDGRVRELLDETGQCPQRAGALPCEGLYRGKLPDERLLESRFKAQAEAGEVARAAFVRVAWREAQAWVPGAVVVSSRGLAYFETPTDGPVFRAMSRVARSQIAMAVEGHVDTPVGQAPAALLTMTDGSTRTLAFGDLDAAMPPERALGELSRVRQFVQLIAAARP